MAAEYRKLMVLSVICTSRMGGCYGFHTSHQDVHQQLKAVTKAQLNSTVHVFEREREGVLLHHTMPYICSHFKFSSYDVCAVLIDSKCKGITSAVNQVMHSQRRDRCRRLQLGIHKKRDVLIIKQISSKCSDN